MVRRLKAVCTDAELQRAHAPAQEFSGGILSPYPDSPDRYDAIKHALQRTDWVEFVEPGCGPYDVPTIVHEPAYVDFLRRAHPAWQAAGGTGDLVTSLFAGTDGRAPHNPARALGYWGFDTTPVTAGTWAATHAAAQAACTATDLVIAGAGAAYALCRPPGHHASRNRFGGYCYLNHAALAAQRLTDLGRVAIIDIDYHHGNGTQQIFYQRADVLFVSLHADPAWEYPLYWGHVDETGADAGLGTTINVPLPAGTDDQGYLTHLLRTLEQVQAFAPQHVVISAGFDTWMNDPLGTFRLSLDGIAAAGQALADLDRPTLIVQEGGYDVSALGDLAIAFLQPFKNSLPDPQPGSIP